MTSETIRVAAPTTAHRTPAETYEQWFVPALFDSLAAHFIQSAQPRQGARVLDVASGTGIVARRIAPRVAPGGSVTGLDFNPAMVAVARAAGERDGLAIDWHQGRAEALPFADHSFDLVVCQQGLQFAIDKPAAVAEMHRVLDVDGRVAVCVWQDIERHPIFAALHAEVLRVLRAPALATPFSLAASELGALFSDAGFQDVDIQPLTVEARFDDPERYVELQIEAASAGIPMLQLLDAEQRAALIVGIGGALRTLIRQFTVGGQLRFAMHSHVAHARR